MAIGRTVRTVDNHSLVAKEDCPGARDLLVSRKILGLGNRGVSVIPDQFDRATRLPRWKLECDFCAWRVGQAMLYEVVAGHLRLYRGRRIQIERPECRIDHVTDPIADDTAAKVHPAAPVPGHPERRVGTKRHGPDPKIVIESFRHLMNFVHLGEVGDLAIDIFESVTAGMNGVN